MKPLANYNHFTPNAFTATSFHNIEESYNDWYDRQQFVCHEIYTCKITVL